MTIDDLPHWIECADEDCEYKHFLTFNRDDNGRWSAGYVEYNTHLAVCTINNADTLQEAAVRLDASIKRNKVE